VRIIEFMPAALRLNPQREQITNEKTSSRPAPFVDFARRSSGLQRVPRFNSQKSEGNATDEHDVHLIAGSDLQRFASALFQALGVAGPMADEWAKSLVWANLRGVDSHGVLRIPSYVDRLKKKLINPTPDMRVEIRAGAIAVLEADRAPGAVAMSRAMEEAISRAREVHFGWCAARNITHAGAIGYFALQAAHAGMAGIVMSAPVR
jgi:LDH2 family malate/lactate/ureidoglycolate dehydrogenase